MQMTQKVNIKQEWRCPNGLKRLAEPTCSVCIADEVNLVEDPVKKESLMLSVSYLRGRRALVRDR